VSRPGNPADRAELERLRAENQRLQALSSEAFDYIRAKVNELLEVVGTRSLRPEELDEQSLLAFDPIGIVATTFRHVLENVRATNRQLQEAHEEIRAIFDTVGSALLVVDPQRRIISFNRQASRLLIRHDGDVVGQYCSQLLCDADPAAEQCVFLQVMNSGKEAALHGKPLRDRYFDVIAGPIFDDSGRISHVVMAYHDVTEARRVEQMKSEFVSTAAHELRTPLATIMGYAELLLSSPEQCKENLQESLKLILGRAEHLAHIVSDLLDISRIEAGEGLKLAFRPCHLDLLCREVAWGHEDASEHHAIELDLPPDGAVIEGDRYALTQVIENLVSNAIKYSPDGGTIRISLRSNDSDCELVVADQGIGMSPAQLEHIFDKFYRANARDTDIPGTGLGMTIVKYLTDAHHGQVFVDSTPGVGTTVKILLPRKQAATE
jgi:PAS domain S-box-containing protein